MEDNALIKMGECFRKARESKKMKQSDVAYLLRTTGQNYSMIERGKRKEVSFTTVKQLCKILGLDISDF
jgi:transcriptional regulator with XRE-family HTH domain